MPNNRSAPGLLLLMLVAITPHDAWSRTTTLIELTCPIGGEQFKTRVERSGSVTCRRFDFKRVGAIGEPPLLPECPSNGFVMISEKLTSSEADKLTPWINSSQYQEELRSHVSYYRLAHISRFLGRSSDVVAWHLLQAAWQVERSDARSFAHYAAEAVAEFDEFAATPPGHATGGLNASTARFLAAELSRRLGAFDDARQRFESLRREMKSSQATLALAINRPIALGSFTRCGRPRRNLES